VLPEAVKLDHKLHDEGRKPVASWGKLDKTDDETDKTQQGENR
jgi:hypothetical protein